MVSASKIVMRWTLSILLLGCSFQLQAAEKLKPEEIIKRFAAKETEFRAEWEKYTYNQRIIFEVLDRSDRVRERREMWVRVFFTTDGERQIEVVEDHGEIYSVGVTREDLEDAIHRQPFVMTSQDLPKYKIKYKGRERVDELDTYVFEVRPDKKKKGERYFQGRIWVDAVDFQIVMTQGKIVPDYGNNKFPDFETVREQIDGKFWFPTWTQGDINLRGRGPGGRSRRVHVRELITYQDFEKYEVTTSIEFEGVKDP